MNSQSVRKYNYIKSIVILLGITMLLSCENSMKEVQSVTSNQDLPLQQGKDVVYIFTDSTKIQYKAYAVEFIETNTEDEKISEFRKGGKIISYDSDETVAWQIKANYAKHYDSKQLWELRNDVVAISDDGKTINTELLFWDQKKKLIYSDQYVRITTEDGQVLEGLSFTSDEEMNKITLTNVTGEVYLDDKTEQ